MERRAEKSGLIALTRAYIRDVRDLFTETREIEHPDNASFANHDQALYDQYTGDLLNQSGACLGEIEYALGISERDPHPDHSIEFDKTASDASRLL